MKDKTARTGTPRLGLEVPDVLLADIRNHPNKYKFINDLQKESMITNSESSVPQATGNP